MTVRYEVKLRVKMSGDPETTDSRRKAVQELIEKHGGKNGTPNPRAHVTALFTDKSAAKAFRQKARAALVV